MQNKDRRIKTINNNKRMGTLYSRNIGVLLSKGKFIFPIDNDDMFFDNDVFKIIYERAKINDYDIVGFKAIRAHSYKAKIIEMNDDKYHLHKNNLLVNQPKLRLFSILNKECHIWGKCIKTNIYKKAVNSLGIKRYSFNICIAEDDTMVFILFNFANSFKFVSKYGIFHLISKNTASFSLSKEHIYFCRMYFLNILYDFTKNNYKEKKYVVKYALNLKKNKLFLKFLNNKNRKFFKLLLKKIINCSFIIINSFYSSILILHYFIKI